ncbi:hypothetical protein AOQ84DRAFT_354856 [Glonium stellatum]|uniref:Secreted protein n=1 Tax=Glonium stellatum TaxID=574774 RepID=A0A8E2EZR7_9PEZI|nr:hypothetical protein AOQ84DRAFT_354856 [Glonium stellatum]
MTCSRTIVCFACFATLWGAARTVQGAAMCCRNDSEKFGTFQRNVEAGEVDINSKLDSGKPNKDENISSVIRFLFTLSTPFLLGGVCGLDTPLRRSLDSCI